jgi:ABC-2 type transport system permease protein
VPTTTVLPRTPNRIADYTNVLRFEACKLFTVRSTFWTLLIAVVANIAIAALAAVFLAGRLSADDKATIDAVRLSLAGLHLSQIAIGVLGVVIITGEYSSGLIRATFSAVPRRRLVLHAKAVVFTLAALVVGTVSSVGAYYTFQALLPDGDSLRSSINDPGVLRAVTGAGLYLAVLGLLGFGLGAIIRSGAGAIATLFGVLFVPPILIDVLPSSWQTTIGPYLPMNAGSDIFITQPQPGSLQPWTGFGVFLLYAVIAVTAGMIAVKHRDA